MLTWLAWLAGIFAIIGVIQQFIGTLLVARFTAQPVPEPLDLPPVSILKPLCGIEPLTELALESFFLLDYPAHQIVFGVQNPADPVLEIITRLRTRYRRITSRLSSIRCCTALTAKSRT